MRTYLITYDLHNVRRYEELHQLLHDWGCIRLAQSVWLVRLHGPCIALRNILAGTIDQDDAVTVIELARGSDWASFNPPEAAAAWLRTNIRSTALAA